MATNQLLPFASGESPNVLPFDDWNSLPARLTGFQSGIASSQQFNRILAQGGAAGYVIGQFVVDYMSQDATIDAEDLYSKFKIALSAYVPGNIANDSIATSKLSERATKQDIENGTAMRVVCADVVKQYFDLICPPGMITFFHATDVPEGWLLCNGAAVSRTTYSRLFAKIGTKYGAGDGSATFTLPNLDGRVLQGTTNTGNVGNYLEASLPNITGRFWDLASVLTEKMGTATGCFSSPTSENSAISIATVSTTQSSGDGIDFSASKSSTIYSGTKLQPTALSVLPCIRY